MATRKFTNRTAFLEGDICRFFYTAKDGSTGWRLVRVLEKQSDRIQAYCMDHEGIRQFLHSGIRDFRVITSTYYVYRGKELDSWWNAKTVCQKAHVFNSVDSDDTLRPSSVVTGLYVSDRRLESLDKFKKSIQYKDSSEKQRKTAQQIVAELEETVAKLTKEAKAKLETILNGE